ncbi:MAG: LacI family DNA-binding transcriptional regulator [Jatrophihabitantaceae bacterium]
MAIPRLRDVAELAGVHTATASRALNPATRGLVNEQTAVRVADAAIKLGYTVNPIARSLKTNRSNSVGVVIPDLTNPLFPPIMRGIDDVLGPAGYSVLLVNTDNDKDREATQIASLRARQVDGLIVATALLHDPRMSRLASENIPLVQINRRMDAPGLPSVTGDDTAGVYLAVRHLASLGHRYIAHLAGPQLTSTGQIRLRAYRQALRDLGLPHANNLIVECEAWTEIQGAQCLGRLFDRKVEFTAVLAGNDLIALGCYDLLGERGIVCPKQISIVGFNDMPIVDKLRPSLTTVHIPQYQVGAEAAQLLLDRIRDDTVPAKSVLLPLELIVRNSTAAPPPVPVTKSARATPRPAARPRVRSG